MVQSYGRPGLDAALLMAPMVGFLDWNDPLMLSTIAAIEQDLTRGEMILRYDVDESADGVVEEENPFLICNFWLVEALARTGSGRPGAAAHGPACRVRRTASVC